ncbi:MAG: C40 family peptidase [Muribaculaceae bacterium]|nr:C40 family peptidase [Muribaculaceae bacterium]
MSKLKFILGILFLLPISVMAQENVIINKINDEIITSVRHKYAPDSRQTIWSALAYDTPEGIVVRGKTSEKKAHEAFALMMQKENISYIDSIIVYPSDNWGIVRISVAHLRYKPSHSAEIVSQALMGTPLRLLEKVGEWWRVQSPDGYISYIIGNSIVRKNADEMNIWKQSNRLIVTSFDQIKVYDTENLSSVRNIITDLVNGCIVNGVISTNSEKVKVTLPDGRYGWLNAKDVKTIEEWANQEFDSQKILDIAYSMMGIPYLWGGMSTKSLDCSGFARVCYFSNGIILMRDASQQALTGKRIEAKDWANCQAGDLLFFGNAKTRKVTHVAIYDNNGTYVHASGRVKRNSVDPKSKEYLTTPFLHAVRIDGNEGTIGITRVSNHSWYFNK